jgi:Protein of unknown function (DUF3833)
MPPTELRAAAILPLPSPIPGGVAQSPLSTEAAVPFIVPTSVPSGTLRQDSLGQPISQPTAATFDLTQFFDGHTAAHGIFEDRFGRVRRRFDGLFIGRWVGDEFVLNETFTFDDGEVDTRIWRLRRVVDGQFSATTEDCIGTARCDSLPLATRMRYDFKLKMKKRVLPVSLDDRIYRLDNRRAMNRCTVSKWGVKLGELSIFLEKVDRV